MKKLRGFFFLVFLIIVPSTVFPQQAVRSIDPNLPTVAIITTGGTIAEKTDPETGGAVPALSGQALLKAVPEISGVANIKVINFSNIDSSQMTPEIWANLSKKVDETLQDPMIKGAVVTHGTDTMAEGAFFLDLTVKSDKPVVFVGAMRDASSVSPDGPANILNGVILASSEEAQGWGVTVALNQYVNSARDVRKTQTTNVQTFNSGEKGYLGYIHGGKVIKFRERSKRVRLPLPEKLPEVVLLATYAGDDGSLLRHVVDSGAEGVVIEGVGAGNVNAKVNQVIEYALSKNVIIVISTRVYHGGVFPIYADKGGGATLKKEGVFLGGDLTPPKARLLLMLSLPHTADDRSKLEGYFET
ncbi:MAG: asparaginase [Candidatus Omnitrophica bacterium]|nr:asparaginase [Candidatus Omnitrophota bacterium]